MKALTIHQPFANHIANGAKRYETRSRSTSYRGPLAIHASKSHEYSAVGPFGAIVAVGRLVACRLTQNIRVSEAEWELGDFTPGRYAWEIIGVEKLAQPVPLRGYQGLWNVPPAMMYRLSVVLSHGGVA